MMTPEESRADLAKRLASTFIQWHLGVSGEEALKTFDLDARPLSAFWLMLAEHCIERARTIQERGGEGSPQPAKSLERVM